MKFKEALQSEKQILVYGASKQGKTALVSRYCGYDEHIVYQLTPTTELIDVYHHVLKKAGVIISTSYTEGKSRESGVNVRAKIMATFAIFGKAEVGASASEKEGAKEESKYEEIPFNLHQPQDVADLLRKVRNKKLIILENFHYLSYQKQKQFAFDLRAFQELGVRFIILGVWRERNRMLQFNGDLLDRIEEIPVEPWREEDFYRIAEKGSQLLNISFSDNIIKSCAEASFSSVGVFQDLLLKVCNEASILKKQEEKKIITDQSYVKEAIRKKADAYADRHKRSLEALASGGPKDEGNIPYCVVQLILKHGYLGIAEGMSLAFICDEIRDFRKKRANLREKSIRKSLLMLSTIQASKGINPPILVFDDNSEMLHVTDSTLYFFMKNYDLAQFSKRIEKADVEQL